MSDAERLRGLEQYKELLQHVMDVYPNKIVFKVTTSPRWIYPSMPEWVTNGGAADTPLTSTSWDGDARSTTAKTKIDLSSVFGAPAGIKAVLLRISAADSGSASGNCSIGFSPNGTAGSYAVVCKCTGRANDDAEHEQGIVPCDAAGDIYFQCTATGSGTLDVITEILGYLL